MTTVKATEKDYLEAAGRGDKPVLNDYVRQIYQDYGPEPWKHPNVLINHIYGHPAHEVFCPLSLKDGLDEALKDENNVVREFQILPVRGIDPELYAELNEANLATIEANSPGAKEAREKAEKSSK